MLKKYFVFCMLLLNNLIIYAQDNLNDREELTNAVDLQNTPDAVHPNTIFQKISKDSFYQVTITTNFDSLIYHKNSFKKYKGTIVFKNAAGQKFKLKVKIEARGRFRRKICTMPPLKIDFSKTELGQFGLIPDFDKLKLVTHCNDTKDSDFVLRKEYWVYKMYNQITEESFKVFPVKITYINEDDGKEITEKVGFIIENNDELAYRLNGEIIEEYGIRPDTLEPVAYHNTMMFQYMIGNVDWSLRHLRNVKFIQKSNQPLLSTVPYDFDYAGLVKAPYARLKARIGQRDIAERFCLGRFSDEEALRQTSQLFLAKKEVIINCFKDCPILGKFHKREMQRYLSSFFKILEKEKKLKRIFLNDTPFTN